MAETTVIRVRGPDAGVFLQGQTSNDIAGIGHGMSQLGSLNSPRGRVIAVFRAWREGENFLLLLPAALAGDFARRLRMFILRSQVTVEDLARTHRQLHLSARDTPGKAGDVVSAGGVSTLRLPGNRLLLHGPADRIEARAASPGQVDAEAWDAGAIRAGMPSVYPATSEMYVAQMLNLDLVGGISFSKGCYTGQEIIARTRHLGRIKRRMLGFEFDGSDAPAPGTPLWADDRKAGTVVHAARSEADRTVLLAVVSLNEAAATLRLGSGAGPALTRFELPYAIPEVSG